MSRREVALITVLLLIALIFISNCGSDTAVLPGSSSNQTSLINPTATPQLITRPVNGFIYGTNSSSETGETADNVYVLDVPPCNADSSGDEPFVKQVENSLKEDSAAWNNPEIQELYTNLSEELSTWRPLPEYSRNAHVFSVYQDSMSDTPLFVNADGSFKGELPSDPADSTVKLEIALDGENYIETETIPSIDSLTSSDSSNITLKSCPERIFAMPGEVVIFKVYNSESANLKSAGLDFILNNSSFGCVTNPVYLNICGTKKYSLAYGCFYIKKGLNTPVQTTITAKINNGIKIEIPVEIVKNIASISGKVFTGGKPLIKGFVRSIGPKACCKLDSEGNFILPKVFKSHNVKVIATYWVEENGKKVRNREVKFIEFLNSDVTDFNFGVPPTPTPTSTPSVTPTIHPIEEHFYQRQVSKVISYYNESKQQLGTEEAMQKTVDWINGQVPSEIPVPEGMTKAYMPPDDTIIMIEFNDGMLIGLNPIEEPIPDVSEIPVNLNKNISDMQKKLRGPSANFITSSESTCFDPNIIILSPLSWEFDCSLSKHKSVHTTKKYSSYYSTIVDEISKIDNPNDRYYNVTEKLTGFEDIEFDFDHPNVDYWLTSDILKAIKNKYNYIDTEKLNQLISMGKVNNDTMINNLKQLGYPEDQINKIMEVALEEIYHYSDPNSKYVPVIECKLSQKGLLNNNIVTPQDYETIGNYGLVYILTHGGGGGIYACLVTENNEKIKTWYDTYRSLSFKRKSYITNQKFSYDWLKANFSNSEDILRKYKTGISYEVIVLTYENFFGELNTDSSNNFKDSIIYMSACQSGNYWYWRYNLPIRSINHSQYFSSAAAYLGYDNKTHVYWQADLSYYLFNFMLSGHSTPVMHLGRYIWYSPSVIQGDPNYPTDVPLSVHQSFEMLNDYYKANINILDDNTEAHLKIYPPNTEKQVYFPAPVKVTVHKN